MITYEYKCSNCNIEITVQQSIKDKPLTKCESCNHDCLERVISGGICSIMKYSSNTLGSAIDKNTSKMGKYELQEKRYNDTKNYKQARKKSKEAAIKKLTGKDVTLPDNVESFCDKETLSKIRKMSPEQQQKWVLEGK